MRCLCSAAHSRLKRTVESVREFLPEVEDARSACVRGASARREALDLGAFGYPMAALYLHYEDASPEFTMKCAATADACSTTSACSATTRSAATRPAWQAAVGCRPKRS